MAMVMLMPMALVMVTGSHASQCVCERIPISAWLDKLAAGGTTPAQWEAVDVLLFRLGIGPHASQGVCKRIPISAWLDK